MDTLKRRMSAGAGGWVERGTAKKMLWISAEKLQHHLGGRNWGDRWVEEDGERGTTSEPPVRAWFSNPQCGTAVAPPSTTIKLVPHHLAAVSCLSIKFCSLTAGFLPGWDLLQKQDAMLGSPRKRVGDRCPLSLMPWQFCSSRAQGHGEVSSKDLLLRQIMIYNCAPSSPLSHLIELL